MRSSHFIVNPMISTSSDDDTYLSHKESQSAKKDRSHQEKIDYIREQEKIEQEKIDYIRKFDSKEIRNIESILKYLADESLSIRELALVFHQFNFSHTSVPVFCEHLWS